MLRAFSLIKTSEVEKVYDFNFVAIAACEE